MGGFTAAERLRMARVTLARAEASSANPSTLAVLRANVRRWERRARAEQTWLRVVRESVGDDLGDVDADDLATELAGGPW
jgi:hypothetical protein